VYDGFFKNDKPFGTGVFSRVDGPTEQGEFVDGVLLQREALPEAPINSSGDGLQREKKKSFDFGFIAQIFFLFFSSNGAHEDHRREEGGKSFQGWNCVEE
jgi:hypothetical protein